RGITNNVDALGCLYCEGRQRLIFRGQDTVLGEAFEPPSAGHVRRECGSESLQVLVIIPVIPPRVADRIVALYGERCLALGRVIPSQVVADRVELFVVYV